MWILRKYAIIKKKKDLLKDLKSNQKLKPQSTQLVLFIWYK